MIKRQRNSPGRLLFRMQTTCAWCGKYIHPDTPVFSRGGTFPPGSDMTALAGQIAPIRFVNLKKSLLVSFPALDSQAKREGNDFVFLVCSPSCGDELAEAIRTEPLIDLPRAVE
jgi:hypothetical protein